MILAIDPGNIESAYVVLNKQLEPIEFAKIENEKLLSLMKEKHFSNCNHFAIEMIASYGMAVGKTVFDTCIWIGRFVEAMENTQETPAQYVYRKDVKINLCHMTKAKDGNVIQALVDRFAPTTSNKGKGIKKDPGFFYGFKADVWQAFACGVTYHDVYVKDQKVIYLDKN